MKQLFFIGIILLVIGSAYSIFSSVDLIALSIWLIGIVLILIDYFKRKKDKKTIILLIIFILIFLINTLIFVEKPFCIRSGGTWETFQDRHADSCSVLIGNYIGIPTELKTSSCNCGPDKCWTGRKCVLNEEYCKDNNKYCK